LEGSKKETKNVRMEKSPYPMDWMFSKYGKKQQPYCCTVVFPNIESGVNGEWGDLATKNSYKYLYSRRNK
jgi:hypothetical protein